MEKMLKKEVKELQKSMDHMIKSTVKQMEEIKDYVTNHKPHFYANDGDIGVGSNTGSVSWQQVLLKLLEIVKPLIAVIREKYPRYFKVVDWCENIIKKIFKDK